MADSITLLQCSQTQAVCYARQLLAKGSLVQKVPVAVFCIALRFTAVIFSVAGSPFGANIQPCGGIFLFAVPITPERGAKHTTAHWSSDLGPGGR